jgi:hypothetical protein
MNKIHKEALSYCQNNDWDAAHLLIQDYSDEFSCRIHGYLHWLEGDLSNASYWYQRTGMKLPENSLPEEFTLLQKIAEKDNQ